MDDTAFLFELSRVENKSMGYAMSLTQYCEDDAQELFQATVVRAYTKKELFTPGSRFDLWIGRIMKNIYLNERVAAQRNTTFDKEFHPTPVISSIAVWNSARCAHLLIVFLTRFLFLCVCMPTDTNITRLPMRLTFL